MLMDWKKIYNSSKYNDSTDETARIRNTRFIKAPIFSLSKEKLL